jgi:hypothetical protein
MAVPVWLVRANTAVGYVALACKFGGLLPRVPWSLVLFPLWAPFALALACLTFSAILAGISVFVEAHETVASRNNRRK